MNKFLQIFGIIALCCVMAFGFVACGDKNDDNDNSGNGGNGGNGGTGGQPTVSLTDDEYYAKFLSAGAYVPTGDYTMHAESVECSIDTSTGGQGGMTQNKFVSSILYDSQNDRYYSSSVGGDHLSEEWVQQKGDKFYSYQFYSDSDSTYKSINEVSPGHIQALLKGSNANPIAVMYSEAPASLAEFEAMINQSIEMMLSYFLEMVPAISEPQVESNSNIDFTENNGSYKMIVTNTTNVVISLSQDVNMDIDVQSNYEFGYNDTMISFVNSTSTVKMNDVEYSSTTYTIDITNNFNTEYYQTLDESDFEGIEPSTNYGVYTTYYVNGKYMDMEQMQYNTSLSSALESIDALLALNDTVQVEWFFDKDYTQPVDASALVKSYDQVLYARVTPATEYALVIVYGAENEIITSANSTVEINLSQNYTYALEDGTPFTGELVVEAGKTYYIISTFNTENLN